jgi:hypothetical protein
MAARAMAGRRWGLGNALLQLVAERAAGFPEMPSSNSSKILSLFSFY